MQIANIFDFQIQLQNPFVVAHASTSHNLIYFFKMPIYVAHI